MVDCKIYPLNPSEQKQLDEFLKEQLETGRIQPVGKAAAQDNGLSE
jgi:hypothetical protein